MNFIRKNKFILIAVLIAIAIFIVYFIREYRASKTPYRSQSGSDYVMIPKTYGINEYTIVSVSDDMLAKLYFSDFKNSVQNDINYSYMLLDAEYRNKRFSGIEEYKKYIQNINLINQKAFKYNTINGSEYTIYVVYDNDNNYYAFKVKGILDYTVYLDENTVEIR